MVFYGAANRIRTGDLFLTKEVLYLLSHSSMPLFWVLFIKLIFMAFWADLVLTKDVLYLLSHSSKRLLRGQRSLIFGTCLTPIELLRYYS